MVHALATLVAQLERDGWERLGERYDWYGYRFRRRISPSRDATQVATTIAQHQLREADSQRVTLQTREPVLDELRTIDPERIEPLLIEPDVAESDILEPNIVEPTSTGLEVGDPNGAEPDGRGSSGSESPTTEPEPDIGEPWFARPPRTPELSDHVAEMAKTILVDRISAYSVDR